MSDKIAVKDAFLHAIEIEKLGAGLYAKLETKVTNPILKKIFSELKVAETEHIESFKKLYASLIDEAAAKGITLSGGGNETEVLKDKVFNRIQTIQNITSSGSPHELLNNLVNIELEVINYYTHLKHFILSKEQDLLSTIINAEKEHVKMLIRERERFKKTSV